MNIKIEIMTNIKNIFPGEQLHIEISLYPLLSGIFTFLYPFIDEKVKFNYKMI